MRADAWPDEPGSPPGSDLGLLQRQLLDEYDVDYGVLNSLGLLGCHEVPEFAAELARVENDWLWEEWLDKEPRCSDRSSSRSSTPSSSVREIERCASDPRWVQVILADTTEEPLGSRKYWPIYEAAAAHGLPVAVHTGGSAAHQGTGWLSYYLEEHVASSLVMQNGLMSMVCEGLFEEVPELRVVLTEGGVTWAVALRWALDSAWDLLRDEVPRLQTHALRVHPTTTSGSRPNRSRSRTILGSSCRRSSTATSPTGSCSRPTTRTGTSTRRRRLSLPTVSERSYARRIFATNACELYGLPLERPGREMEAEPSLVRRLRRPLRAGVDRRAPSVPERVLAGVHRRSVDPDSRDAERLSARGPNERDC